MQCEYEDKECNEKCRDFNTCTRNTCTVNPCKPINVLEKIKVVLTSLEDEADFCHQVAEYMDNDKMYESAGRMKVKEDAYRECISMIKEELGMV